MVGSVEHSPYRGMEASLRPQENSSFSQGGEGNICVGWRRTVSGCQISGKKGIVYYVRKKGFRMRLSSIQSGRGEKSWTLNGGKEVRDLLEQEIFVHRGGGCVSEGREPKTFLAYTLRGFQEGEMYQVVDAGRVRT